MIIDCHGHYTTAPKALEQFRERQLAEPGRAQKQPIAISDDEIRESLEKNQLRIQRERGTDLTFYSPRASSRPWLRVAGMPRLRSCTTTRTRASSTALATSGLPSLEPSSTTSTS